MELFTKIDIPASSIRIDYTSRIAFFGSCFADNISAQFTARKFGVLANPFGTVYNPVSIAGQIKAIADGKVFGESDVFQDACGPWHSWDAHGSLSGSTREECIEKLNNAATRTREFLKQADVVFITLGTAFVYFLKDGRAVANCHRQDPALFERRMITVEEAARALREIERDLRKIRTDIRIVFTVSPLRHMADGAHNNTLSKATLLLAINSIKQKAMDSIGSTSLQNDIAEYFPSYEIVMDELRDYRFYDSDMVHLSKTAEEYIFERMVEAYCDEKTRTNIARVEKFMKMANHRVSDTRSPASASFAQKAITQAKTLEKDIPGLDLVAEIAKFNGIAF
ncbi:MAG: GSCFA domain-containing protein [Fibrobacter sp.]|nr:GSCFA domain-containing protein [Fibrobacter sp.]